MYQFRDHTHADGTHYTEVISGEGEVLYVSATYPFLAEAKEDAESWCVWFDGFPENQRESIYYILAVPIAWPDHRPAVIGTLGCTSKLGEPQTS